MMDYNNQGKRIRKTSDAGASWDTIATGINAINLFYNDPQHIWLFGSNNNIYTLGTTTGIRSYRNLGHMRLYPNPASNIICIEHDHQGPEPTLVSIYTMTGEKLMQALSHGRTSIDISSLPAGAYQLSSDRGMHQLFIKTGL